MKHHFIFVFALFSSATFCFAQDAVISSGGNASGTTGSVSYTVGQVFYTTPASASGAVAQGVQQPFEIQTLLSTTNFNINVQMSVYPNPTSNAISLQIKDIDLNEMKYELFDMNGRLVAKNVIVSANTTLQLNDFQAAMYVLNIIQSGQVIKSFKVIKNN